MHKGRREDLAAYLQRIVRDSENGKSRHIPNHHHHPLNYRHQRISPPRITLLNLMLKFSQVAVQVQLLGEKFQELGHRE